MNTSHIQAHLLNPKADTNSCPQTVYTKVLYCLPMSSTAYTYI